MYSVNVKKRRYSAFNLISERSKIFISYTSDRSDQVLTRFRLLITKYGRETVICNKVIICWGHCGETYKSKNKNRPMK